MAFWLDSHSITPCWKCSAAICTAVPGPLGQQAGGLAKKYLSGQRITAETVAEAVEAPAPTYSTYTTLLRRAPGTGMVSVPESGTVCISSSGPPGSCR